MSISLKKPVNNITKENVDTIVAMIEQWEGPITWELLAMKVSKKMGGVRQRQGLQHHAKIKDAYREKKQSLRDKKNPTGKTVEVRNLMLKLEQAEQRIKALEADNQEYRERFERYIFNASRRSIYEQDLDKALPPINRQ